MDPDKALADMRAALEAVQSTPDWALERPTYSWTDALDSLIETVDALDDWLSKGGFLPALWDRDNNHNQKRS